MGPRALSCPEATGPDNRDDSSQIDQICRTGIFENGLQHREGDENRPESKADRTDHEGEPEHDACDMRQCAAEAVGESRRQAA